MGDQRQTQEIRHPTYETGFRELCHKTTTELWNKKWNAGYVDISRSPSYVLQNTALRLASTATVAGEATGCRRKGDSDGCNREER